MQPTATLRAIIIGGGIGGLTAARALRRVAIDATVFERARQVQQLYIGAGITLQINAMRALRYLDLDEQVRAVGAVGKWSEFCTWRGEKLARWHEAGVSQNIGATTVHISRAALHPVLVAAVDEGALRLGAECTGFTQDETGVTARFADGSEARGDLLIGAEGLYSVVRAQLLGKTRPRYAGYAVWRGVPDIEHDLLPDGLFRMWWGRGARFCVYPVGPKQLYWFGVANASEEDRDPVGGRKAVVLERFRGWAEPIEEVVRATEETAIHRTPIYDRPPVTRWGEGRVTLLGDAAHPMTFNLGQGACQAIEDAVVLARCLSAHPVSGGVVATLRDYERQRLAPTAAMTTLSWRIGRMGRLEHPLACGLRDQIIKQTFERFVVPRQVRAMSATH